MTLFLSSLLCPFERATECPLCACYMIALLRGSPFVASPPQSVVAALGRKSEAEDEDEEAAAAGSSNSEIWRVRHIIRLSSSSSLVAAAALLQLPTLPNSEISSRGFELSEKRVETQRRLIESPTREH